MVAELGERPWVSKRATQNSDMHRFDFKKLNDAEVKEQYKVKI
jgi:hypothetical protein